MRFTRLGLFLVGLVVALVGIGWQQATSQQPRYETRIVVLRSKANLAAVWGNKRAVKSALMQVAERSQRELLPQLEAWRQQGEVRRYRRFWIINAIAVEATDRVFEALRQHPAVAAIRQNPVIPGPRPIPSRQIAPQQAYTWGLQKIRVPEAWRTFEVQGEGVVVGVIDSGIDPNHPDLRGKIRPQNGWFDPINGRPDPYDDDPDGHGTHVAGTIAGGNASGTHIGVAPRATLIVAKGLDATGIGTFEWLTACMQWMLDPDGDPNTDDGADVVNNSWGGSTDSPNMIPEWEDILNSWVAARIFPAFAIGNEGPGPRTTASPGDYPMAFGVGATDVNDGIADFSSRGPVFWTGIGEIVKPDVSAPGVDILSAIPGGGYASYQGTSTACPHVAGTVALMLSLAIKNRRLADVDVDFLKRALEETAVDLGAPGKDNDYGSGRIDAFEALRRIPPPPIVGIPSFIGSRIEVSTPEVVTDERVDYTVRVVNSGNGRAISVLVKVLAIPTHLLSDIVVLDGGTFDPFNREISWTLPELVPGQTVSFQFSARAVAEGVVGLVAQISAANAGTFTTDPAALTIVSPRDPFEANDLPIAASSIAAPEDLLSERAYLAAGDRDWFKFVAPAGKVFWVEVRAWQLGSPLDAKLAVTSATGQPLPPNEALIVAPDYLGHDPVAIVKGNGGEVYLQVTYDDDAAPAQRRGSYRLRVREITTSAALEQFGAEDLVGERALRAGETALVFGILKNQGSRRHQFLSFHFAEGLRLIAPSQARTYLPPGLRTTDINGEAAALPSLADWLLFVADPNEATLSEVRLPTAPLNLGRIWVQEREAVLFFRTELAGRLLSALADMELTIDLDTNGDEQADAQIRITATEQVLVVGALRRPLAHLTVGERLVDIGVRWSDIGDMTRLWARARLKDRATGSEDYAPDFGWALLTRGGTGFAYGVSPAAGTVLGGSPLTMALIADARYASLGEGLASATVREDESTLFASLVHELPVTVVAGPPAFVRLTLSAESVPATHDQVSATVEVTDAAGNPVVDQRVRWTVTPTLLGTIDGSGIAERVTDENGKSTVVIGLTGRVGTLTVQAEVVGTTLIASRSLTVTLGELTALEVLTTPAADAEGRVLVSVGGTVTVRVSTKDARGNPFARSGSPVQLQVGVVPVEGDPQVRLIVDGSPGDEDGAVNGTIQFSLPVGTKAGTILVSIIALDNPSLSQQVTVIVQPGIVHRLAFVDAQQESELSSSLTSPLVRLLGDRLQIGVRVSDAHDNPIPEQTVVLTVQRGFLVQTFTVRTDETGKAVVTLPFDAVGTYAFAFAVGGVRQPSDWSAFYRVQVLPKLEDVPAEQVRGLGLPFLPPVVPTGQQPPTLSELLGVAPEALRNRIVVYDPLDLQNTWKFVDPNEPATRLRTGVGFFIKPRQTVSFRPQAGRLPDRDTVEITLQSGWNLISFPIAVSFPWRLSTILVRSGGLTQPLAQATTVVAPFLWRWDSQARAYRLVYDRSLVQGDFEGTIEPWESYFAYAYQPCTLIVPVPSGSRKEEPIPRNAVWRLFSLQVQQGEETTVLLLGLSREGKSVDIALPPSPIAPHRTALLGSDGSLLGASVKAAATKVIWTLAVTGSDQEEEVVVSGANLAALDKEWSLTLVDPVAGLRCSLRTSAYRFRLAAGEQRHLLIIAERGNGQPLRVQNLKATSLRGRSVGIEFTLTAPARVTVTVHSLTGRTVQVLEAQQWRPAGTHRLVWDGTGGQKQRLPLGSYLLRVQAEDDLGRRAQSTLWLPLR